MAWQHTGTRILPALARKEQVKNSVTMQYHNTSSIPLRQAQRTFKGVVKHMPTIRATIVNHTRDNCQPYARHMFHQCLGTIITGQKNVERPANIGGSALNHVDKINYLNIGMGHRAHTQANGMHSHAETQRTQRNGC